MRIAILLAALAATAATAAGARAEPAFNRIASFPVDSNLPQGADPNSVTSAEIIAASEDGMTLVYTDSPLGALGFVDIADPAAPRAGGSLALDGEPTSVAVAGGMALVGVNTSPSYLAPSGHLAVVDIASRSIVATCDLGGQPDSVAVSPDKSILAIAIENERDEDLNDGVLPQLPAGNVTLFSLDAKGIADCGSRKLVELTGLAEIGGDDPEPEFVSINGANQVVVTLQENNHLALIDGASGKVIGHFGAGTVDLENVDLKSDGALVFDGSQSGRKREPDAVKWIDEQRFVIANEGDYEGGSRGFTIFTADGEVAYESGMDLEHRIVLAGHYPDKRSSKKGSEAEGIEVGRFGAATYIFVGAERASAVGVYQDTGGAPLFVQLLPSGIGPEGSVAIPARNLFVTANEEDLVEENGLRAHVMIYALEEGPPAYPQIVSSMDEDGRPVGWGALSGLAADPEREGLLYAVSDSFYRSQPAIFTIDASQTPARIVDKLVVTRDGMPAQKLDLEGIAIGPDGDFWVASEGRGDHLVPHALYKVDRKGRIREELPFPAALLAGETRFGAEGIALVGAGDEATLWVAIQREWADDPAGTVKLLSYNLASKDWGQVRYPLEAPSGGWVGLSEITAHGDAVYVLERDNQLGARARIKKLFKVALSELKSARLGEEPPLVKKTPVHDFLPELAALKGFVVDKIEGFAIDKAGLGYAVTDNDGVDDSSGETYFFSIGKM